MFPDVPRLKYFNGQLWFQYVWSRENYWGEYWRDIGVPCPIRDSLGSQRSPRATSILIDICRRCKRTLSVNDKTSTSLEPGTKFLRSLKLRKQVYVKRTPSPTKSWLTASEKSTKNFLIRNLRVQTPVAQQPRFDTRSVFTNTAQTGFKRDYKSDFSTIRPSVIQRRLLVRFTGGLRMHENWKEMTRNFQMKLKSPCHHSDVTQNLSLLRSSHTEVT